MRQQSLSLLSSSEHTLFLFHSLSQSLRTRYSFLSFRCLATFRSRERCVAPWDGSKAVTSGRRQEQSGEGDASQEIITNKKHSGEERCTCCLSHVDNKWGLLDKMLDTGEYLRAL